MNKYACHNGHYEVLDEFLPFLTDSNTAHRALAWSAEKGRARLIKRILEYPGVDVNAKVRGDTALYIACKTADRDSIVTLLEAGADPTITCGDTCGGFGSGRMFYLDKIKDETRGFTALHALCCTGRRSQRSHTSTDKADPDVLREVFSLLLQHGANIHQRTFDGSTALYDAMGSTVLTRNSYLYWVSTSTELIMKGELPSMC
jgi:ankyrin repeat protein